MICLDDCGDGITRRQQGAAITGHKTLAMLFGGKTMRQGVVSAGRNELRQWLADLPGPWMGAMEATLFTGWIYDFLKPHAVELTERNISVGCWDGKPPFSP